MDIACRVIFRFLFRVACIVSALCMVGYWFYKFEIEDRDVGIVDYKPFENASKVRYPVPSLCSYKPFSRKKVLKIDPNVNIQKYLTVSYTHLRAHET